MAARFDTVVRYDVHAHCITPLRTANSSGDTEAVLRRADGTPFVQGSSIAGALRSYAERKYDKASAEAMFGSPSIEGRLLISDGVFDASAQQSIRPHVRIDGASGSASNGGKFDIAHINAGAGFDFTIVWKGCTDLIGDTGCVETMLGAMDSGDITLGGQKTNGFGRVTLCVKKSVFDLKNAADRAAWLRDEVTGAEIDLPRNTGEAVRFVVTGTADEILVKASAPEAVGEKTYTVNIKENGRAILPGSSVKGVVRARAEMIADYLSIDNGFTEGMFGRMSGAGDNGLPGHVRFSDMTMSGTERQITRIRINRFTGGVIRGGLFCEKPQSTPVELEISAPNHPAECALLLLALRDLGLNLYSLGGGSAIGRGYVKVKTIEATLPDGRSAKLQFDGHGGFRAEGDDVFSGWLKELEVLKHDN